MNLLKKIAIKLTLIIIIFMLIIFTTNIILLNNSFKRNIEFTCEAKYHEIVNSLEKTVKMLELTTEKISNNEKIIEILDTNREFDDLDKEDTTLMMNQINAFEGILKSLTFVETINITSIQGNYLFSNGVLYKNFKTEDRPWFTEELINNNGKSIISDIHSDYNTGRKSMSVVSLIYSEEDNSILGAAVLDIFIDDLIKFINSDFYLGNLETYIKLEDGKYYGSDGTLEECGESTCKYYIKMGENIITDGLSMIFKFDKESIIYSKSFKEFNEIQIIIYLILGVILTIILIRILKSTFRPIEQCINKFKSLLKTSEYEDIDFKKDDEVKQLEFISNALRISFDNKIKSLIYYDELTKLPNRKMLIKKVEKLINGNNEFALIFIDLNKFKKVNDLFGHLTGDEILKYFSSKVNKVIKEGDMLCRYSGDEFIILYTNYKSENDLNEFYKNSIVPIFKKPIVIYNNNIIVEFAAGVAIYPKDGNSLDEIINKSDFMMYENKSNSSINELLYFNDDIYKKLKEIEIIKSELKLSVNKNEFILYYQPIVDKNKIVKKVEALIRWKNERLGFVSPLEFINYAEETGDIINIGYWIIEDVCKNYKYMTNSYKHELQVSINVSPIQLMAIDFAENMKKIIDKYEIEYKNICVEITESVVLDDSSVVMRNIIYLNRIGIKIALDDFGTGYASFNYLKKFKLDMLKIDKIFIDDASEVDYKIVENIKNISGHLLIDTIIEGVETVEQFNVLRDIGCDLFQGYYFSKPMTLENMKVFLNEEI